MDILRKICIVALCLGLIFTCCSCKNKNDAEDEKEVLYVPSNQDIAAEMLASLTLEEKAAQMLIISFSGNSVTAELETLMKELKPGGFILFDNNFSNHSQTTNFINTLNSYNNIPLIISTDQEGGRVQRLKEPLALNIPDMLTLGKTENTQLAFNVGKVMAEEMRVFGVNVTFAPVLDVFSNKNNTVIGNRSFSDNAETAGNMAISLAQGLQENGVTAVYKHFPGHGDTATDSHKALPIINKTKNELEKTELVPFKKAIENNARIIMVGHIALPAVTGNNHPASLSKEIITNLLKEEMGYNGLVITDALNMGALTKNYTSSQIYSMAIDAGVDILLMPTDPKEAINYIVNNVSEERINESVYKILLFKLDYLSDYKTLDSSYLKSEEHKKVIDSVK